jgi:hypothetical protein
MNFPLPYISAHPPTLCLAACLAATRWGGCVNHDNLLDIANWRLTSLEFAGLPDYCLLNKYRLKLQAQALNGIRCLFSLIKEWFGSPARGNPSPAHGHRLENYFPHFFFCLLKRFLSSRQCGIGLVSRSGGLICQLFVCQTSLFCKAFKTPMGPSELAW